VHSSTENHEKNSENVQKRYCNFFESVVCLIQQQDKNAVAWKRFHEKETKILLLGGEKK